MGFHLAFSTVRDFTQNFYSFPTNTLLSSGHLNYVYCLSVTLMTRLRAWFVSISHVNIEDERPFRAIIGVL